MRRKLLTGAIILVASILLLVGVLALFPMKETGKELLNAAVNVDEKLELHMEGYQVKLIAWDKEEIKIKESRIHEDLCDDSIELAFEDNVLTINSNGISMSDLRSTNDLVVYHSQIWLSLLQVGKYFDYFNEVWDYSYVDFYVYVPDGAMVDVYSSGMIGAYGNANLRNIDVNMIFEED